MKSYHNTRSWRRLLSAGLLATVGLGFTSLVPVLADPPDHAPAHGYRRKQERKHDNRNRDDWRDRVGRDRDDRNNDTWRKRRERNNRQPAWQREQRRERAREDFSWQNDRIGSNRGRTDVTWARRDSDGDGVRNGQDRYPRDSKRH